jgi:hypothetical protein
VDTVYLEHDMGTRKGKKGLTRRRRAAIRAAEDLRKMVAGLTRQHNKEEQDQLEAEIPQLLSNENNRGIDVDCWTLRNKALRKRLMALAEVAGEQRPGLLRAPYIVGLTNLSRADFDPPNRAWQPRGRGLSQGFRSLVEHMLGGYPASKHLVDSLLLELPSEEHGRALARVVHRVIRGSRVADLVGSATLPYPLTRRMCHLLVNPDRPGHLVELVRSAQVAAHGGGEVLVRALLKGPFGDPGGQNREVFRDEAIHWFCRQEGLSPEQIDVIAEHLERRWREDHDFKMKGRTATALLREAGQYRRDQEALARLKDRSPYGASGFQGSRWRFPRREHGRQMPDDIWTVQEFLDPQDLVREGRRLCHCVATYHMVVRKGQSSIWSLAVNGTSRVTIEVRNREGRIIQAKGMANRRPRVQERRLLRGWAKKNGLELCRDLVG